MKAFLILIDSLNRHFLPCYNPDTKVMAEHLTRFSQENITFDSHYVASAPCMPARRDIFTGRINFLERNWGGMEPFDVTLISKLREHGIFTHITTDHPHYFEIGGENYCQMFHTWNFERGQEGDVWVSRVKGSDIPQPHYGKVNRQNQLNRLAYTKEEEYPTPRTFRSACNWIDSNRDADDYFMMVEAFDPHEPFDCTENYRELYPDAYDGPYFDWPSYQALNEETPEAMEHLRNEYSATLTMMDHWFGTFIQKLKDTGIYDESLIVVTSDHGHMLGEHGFAAKNFMPAYQELVHIPLFVHLPGSAYAGKRISSLTQNIDLMPTFLEYFKTETPKTVQGKSLLPMIPHDTPVRDKAVYGWFGKAVNVTDGTHTYFRAPVSEDNQPCFLYGAMPTTFLKYWDIKPGDYEMGTFLPYTDFPVYKVRYRVEGHYPECPEGLDYVRENLLFDIQSDPCQNRPIKDKALELEMIEKLRAALLEYQAPQEQLIRLGIKENRGETVEETKRYHD
ncbi:MULTISPECIES: sulfatase [Hungatella]|uniref:Sulfatase-like hydrolase/transferase n=1 Tax=Hungatella hathewayi TaxID=154046 RepID=A0AAW9WB61_9FIRM|nr:MULTISPECIES: sulfatase [Hungatella]MCQ4832273.1 sulfatase [Hungatella sp. SL.1.14]MUB61936.1 sulfatase-like hydrolase/transferase [Hungatella hathewayi]CUP50750.1 sulfatase [Hungatella hathewayi]